MDELFLARAPLLVSGTEPTIIEGPPLPGPPRLRLVSLLEDESYLFARYARRWPVAATSRSSARREQRRRCGGWSAESLL